MLQNAFVSATLVFASMTLQALKKLFLHLTLALLMLSGINGATGRTFNPLCGLI
jgi:hypothetical protein